MNIDLTNKNALVCGSTQGIGKATAEALAKSGASVTLLARNEEKLKMVCAALDKSKHQVHDYIAVDYSNQTLLKDAVVSKVKEKGVIHILINNTGGPPGGQAIDASIEEYIKAFNNHLICNQIITTSVIGGMKAEKFGRIINIISTSVKQPLKGLGVSNTIRGAVANWSKTLANELGQYGINVNNVLPGATNTQRLTSIIENKAKKTGKTIEAIEKEMQAEVPLQRFAKPEELANAVLFLASKEAAYITGINLPVDGGRTACL